MFDALLMTFYLMCVFSSRLDRLSIQSELTSRLLRSKRGQLETSIYLLGTVRNKCSVKEEIHNSEDKTTFL